MDERGKRKPDLEPEQPVAEKTELEETAEGNARTDEIEALRQQLEEKEREAEENYERFLRQAAELENFKKRAARDREELSRYANEALVKDLLPVVDNLERAVDYAKGGGDGKPLSDGVEMVLKSLHEVLSKYGVTQVSALGESFDPSKHEAIAQIDSAEREPNTVVEEHQKGYYLADRLIRPSLVTVTKRPEDQEKKGEESSENEVEKGKSDD